ncbi:MAG: heme ABC exporter ATP-binding protein CcmA [Gemmatimonadaceae bacterium]
MPEPAPTVQAVALRKSFGRRAAVAGVDFALSAGECLAVFGPNGAGKTTLLRLVAGLLKPTAGSTTLNGADARRDANVRAHVGLISHQSMLYAPLTALENVEFAARLYGLADPRAAARAALEAMRILDRAGIPVRTLSRGLQQRVSIARAMVHEPTVVLLDEPYSGLDEAGAGTLTSLLNTLRDRGATLLVVTHNVAEGLALATHAAIMTGGRFERFEQRRDATGFDAQRFTSEYRELVGVRHVG